ncbi:MAG TPA: response regulator transcription factor [Candidatus Limnocylindrales bacterium]|jgi:DNA-binding NarL/FixJ family response regulator
MTEGSRVPIGSRQGGSVVDPGADAVEEAPLLGPGRRPIKVGLVEDHHLFREGLRLVLDRARDIDVVGEAATATEAFDVLERCRPDVMLVDLSLGQSDGISILRAISARRPEIRLVVLSMHRDAETVRQALLAGATGYVAKGAHSLELLDAIRAVMRGESYLHSSVTGAIVDDSLRWLRSGGPLSAREREILRLIAAGNSTRAVGDLLGISPHTVRRHLANLSAKLGLRGISALVRYAAQHGLVREEA